MSVTPYCTLEGSWGLFVVWCVATVPYWKYPSRSSAIHRTDALLHPQSDISITWPF